MKVKLPSVFPRELKSMDEKIAYLKGWHDGSSSIQKISDESFKKIFSIINKL